MFLALIVVAVLASSKLLPPIRNALSGMWAVARDRHKRLELFGGNLGSELLYALALGSGRSGGRPHSRAAALGVDDSTAFTIAFTHRLCTYYLPPIWGYFSMQWLRGKAYI